MILYLATGKLARSLQCYGHPDDCANMVSRVKRKPERLEWASRSRGFQKQDVVQSVERVLWKHDVVGSSPAILTRFL